MSDEKLLYCWSCHSPIHPCFFCKICSIIQPPSFTNPFELFGFDSVFDIQKDQLDQLYFDFQNRLHPDRFAMKTQKEKRLAVQQSIAVNDAYTLLKSPLSRADYLCVSLLGGRSYKNEDNRQIPSFLLMESLEKRMVLDKADDDASLLELSQKSHKDQERITSLITAFFQDNFQSKDINELQDLILSLQYEERFLQEVNKKKQKIEKS